MSTLLRQVEDPIDKVTPEGAQNFSFVALTLRGIQIIGRLGIFENKIKLDQDIEQQ